MLVTETLQLTWMAGSVTAAQIATLFQNLGQPLPYDRLTKIMSDYAPQKGEAPSTPASQASGKKLPSVATPLVFFTG